MAGVYKKRATCGWARLMCLLISILLLPAAVQPAVARQSSQRNQIRRPAQLETMRQIERFVMQLLTDKTKRQDPFIAAERQQQRTQATYEMGSKPRPQSGFARYDIEQLTLTAIWEEDEQVVAMFRAIDNKLFIVSVGEEAYDGRIVEISFEEKAVKFLRRLERIGPRVSGQPDYKYETVLVRMRQ